jgi:hypothetical protein
LAAALSSHPHFKDQLRESKGSLYPDDRVWYDQFTSTDWVHDSIADAYRVKALRSRTDIRGRIKSFFDGTQGWILSALVGFLTATIAYAVDVSEAPVFDWKDGYCSDGFLISEKVSEDYDSYPFTTFNHDTSSFPCARQPLTVSKLQPVSLLLTVIFSFPNTQYSHEVKHT